jgi:hypothetical protein
LLVIDAIVITRLSIKHFVSNRVAILIKSITEWAIHTSLIIVLQHCKLAINLMVTIKLNLIVNEHPLALASKVNNALSIIILYKLTLLQNVNISSSGQLCINLGSSLR